MHSEPVLLRFTRANADERAPADAEELARSASDELARSWLVVRSAARRLDRLAAEQGWPAPFHPVRYLILAHLHAATVFGLSPGRLARLIAVRPSTLAHHLDALERSGMIERRPRRVADMRKVAVRLTDIGRYAAKVTCHGQVFPHTLATIMETSASQIESFRRFSRFYTKQIGLLEEGLLASPYSLTEARIIYELAHVDRATATTLAERLALDPGYLSRILRGLGRRGLIDKRRSEEDRRLVRLSLSERGRAEFAQLDQGSRRQIRGILERLAERDRERVIAAMGTVERLLSGPGGADARLEPDRPPFTLRPHRPGDVGWVVERHGALYTESHGWDARFEAMCADIGARFLRDYDPRWERTWIAERDGARVGAVFLVRRSKTIGQLRFLFVEPSARGLGLGARLVSECVGHARHVGYRTMTLFTMRGLDSARRLYEAEGFRLVEETPGEGWAEGGGEQRWDLTL